MRLSDFNPLQLPQADESRRASITETVSRTMEWWRQSHPQPSAEDLLNETLYFERQRLKRDVHAPGKAEDIEYFRSLGQKVRTASHAQQAQLLEGLVERYANEIIGHFNPLLFSGLTKYGAPSLSVLLNSMSPLKLLDAFSDTASLDDSLVMLGQVDQLVALSKLGSIVLVPTHVSNFDSVVLGFALARLGLPPFLYGAGYNLFKHPLLAPFMRRLGAYTVDREKKAPLYKQVLKTYATVSMEEGRHHIFFPGGTRSRSGKIENKLKKGLLGCGLAAYGHSLARGKEHKVFVVPCTLTYQMVLEAETLIADHLAEAGKARYIILDDESSRIERVTQFVRALLKHQSRISLHIGQAMDPFGNRVRPDGVSIDRHDRPIDIAGYCKRNGRIVADAQRDEEYTSELSEAICQSYPSGAVISPTHVVAYELFDMLRSERGQHDLIRLLRDSEPHPGFPIEPLRQRLAERLATLRRLANEKALILEPVVATSDPDEILSRALVHFTVYHQTPVIERRGTRVFVLDRALVYYYRNRLDGFSL